MRPGSGGVLLGAVGERAAAGGDVLASARGCLAGAQERGQADYGEKCQGERDVLAHGVILLCTIQVRKHERGKLGPARNAALPLKPRPADVGSDG
jgi:hypothetical protein